MEALIRLRESLAAVDPSMLTTADRLALIDLYEASMTGGGLLAVAAHRPTPHLI